MRSMKVAAVGCLLVMGVAACGQDDGGGGGASQGSIWARDAEDLLVAAAPGRFTRSRPRPWWTARSSRSSRPAGRPARTRSSTSRWTTRRHRPASGRRRPSRPTRSRPPRTTRRSIYLGTLNSGAAKISIPILNEAQIPMISPANTVRRAHLRRAGLRAGRARQVLPDRHAHLRPRRRRSTSTKARRSSPLMKQEGCTKVAMTNDKEVYGAGLARVIEMSAKEQGLTLTANDAIDKNASNYRALATRGQDRRRRLLHLLRHHGQQRGPAVQGLRGRARRRTPSSTARTACATARFAAEKEGGIPASLNPQVKCTVANPRARRVPARRPGVLQDLQGRSTATTADPYAIYGYEAHAARAGRDQALQDR